MRRTLSISLAALAALAGCGGGGGGNAKPADIPAGPGPTATTPATPKASTNLKNTKVKPAVPKQKGKPPTKLVVKDIVVGKGRAAKKGDRLSMQYVGVTYADGNEFDSSWDRGQPFKFQLGKGSVIKGWDQGLVGIKPGGRRELIIPAKLGYGATGQPPSIPPNAALVFIVDALSVGK
jgi:FKBP-type peptidyl-prolyl cis-trans isomerase